MFRDLSRSTLEDLARSADGGATAWPYLSFYLPTHRYPGPESLADRVELDNLLRRAAELLAAEGIAADDAGQVLEPVRALLDDPALWQHPGDGLAIFLGPGRCTVVHAAASFLPEVTLGRHFRLTPLLPALPGVERFYVLALSINAVRLLEATPAGVERLAVPGMPASMEDALGYDQYYSEVQVHSAGPRGLGRQAAVVHGHGDADEERFDQDLLTYFRRVTEPLRTVAKPGLPVVLAAVSEYYPLFRRAASELDLVTGIAGNPELLSDEELAEAARQVLERSADERTGAALERFHELADRRRASSDAAEIVDAAYHGRVDTLFVRPGAAWWGAYQPDLCRVDEHRSREPGDDDLVDLAVTRTLAQGGEVSLLPAGEDLGPLAAILRYSTAPQARSA